MRAEGFMGAASDWIQFFRAGNCLSGFVGVFLGATMALGEIPSGDNLHITSLLALSVYTFMASWNALNDYLDLEIDKVNRPDRPLPSGRIGEKTALLAIILTGLLSFAALFLAGQIATSIGEISDWQYTIWIWLIALLLLLNYEDDRWLLGLKDKGFPGNLAISLSVGLVILFGAAGVYEPFHPKAISLFVMGTLFNTAREVIKDVEDMEGDEGRNTLAMRIGAESARMVAWLFLLLTMVSIIAPFALEIFEQYHLLFMAPSLYILMTVKKHIALGEDTSASSKIKQSMYLAIAGMIASALL